ncbi:MAG: hypothetical protein EBQ99_03645 [Planctomycetes bacterium]|nr:hypothetical protein [Planctomycetota bacterium]
MRRLLPALLALAVAMAVWASTDETPLPQVPAGTPELRVGVFPNPPYATQLGDGQWSGVSVTLFRQCAEQLKLPYRLVSFDTIHAALEAIRRNELDVIAVGLDVTPERERFMDFTRAFEQSGTSAAVRLDRSPTLLMLMRHVANSHLPRLLAGLLAVMLVVAVLLSLFERRRNPGQFGGGWLQSIGESMWWSVTTMTTVGYGDRVPVTRFGRLLGGVWMLVAFVLMTVLGGVIASELTVSRFQPMIRGVDQLKSVRCGAVEDSAAQAAAIQEGLKPQAFPTLTAALQDLQDLRVDAVLGDTAALRWLLRSGMYPDLTVLPDPLVIDYICFGVSHRVDPGVLDALNYWVLRVSQSPEWQSSRRSTQGDSP